MSKIKHQNFIEQERVDERIIKIDANSSHNPYPADGISQEDALEIVSTFLARFYHEETNYALASTRALRTFKDNEHYELQVASAFRRILESPLADDVLFQLVREDANRAIFDSKKARAFLEEVFEDTNLKFVE